MSERKIYNVQDMVDAERAGSAKDKHYYWTTGPWTDDICWKSLMYEDGYTHVEYDGRLFTISKHGPKEEVF